MSTETTVNGPKKHQPFVPETMEMKEFTFRAVFLGLIMTVVLGAANAYLGLRAGITIAATYPAAVIGWRCCAFGKGRCSRKTSREHQERLAKESPQERSSPFPRS